MSKLLVFCCVICGIFGESIKIDDVCELVDIDYFLDICSIRHGNFVESLLANNQSDAALTEIVNTLELDVRNIDGTIKKHINDVQNEINGLISSYQTTIQTLINGLPSFGAKKAESLSDLTDIMSNTNVADKILFTKNQMQIIILIILGFNALLVTGFIIYACVGLQTQIGNNAAKDVYKPVAFKH